MKILAYLNEKFNSNRRFFPPERGATLRYATLRTGRNVETNAPSILALASLGLALAFARRIQPPWCELYKRIILYNSGVADFRSSGKNWQGNFLYTGKNWQGKTAYGGSPPGTDGGRHWQNLVKSVYLINPQHVSRETILLQVMFHVKQFYYRLCFT